MKLHIHCLLWIFTKNLTTYDSIGLEYQVFLNLYVIYRSNMICKWSLHIFGNLIAHWLLASQGSFTPDARVSWRVFFVLEWVLNGRVWLLAQGNPWWNKPVKRTRRFPLYISSQQEVLLFNNSIALYVNLGSGNGLVLSGNKLSPEPMKTVT